MFLKLIRDLARPRVFTIIDTLKRSTGMTAGEMCRALKMSPTAVKQHCADLQKQGLVDTWRRSGTGGRPEKLWRLTAKAAHFYPDAGNELAMELLQCIQQLHGTQAPDKLLFMVFTRKAELYQKKVKGKSIADRATSLAKLRDAEGHSSKLELHPVEGLRIVEYHNPLKEIAEAWPAIKRIEEQMISKVLNSQVTRTEQRVSGLVRIVFSIPTLSSGPAPAADLSAGGGAGDSSQAELF